MDPNRKNFQPQKIPVIRYATGTACQQRTLTPPDTWSCPTLGLACILMSRPISPELVLSPDLWISNIPRYFSFALVLLWENERQKWDASRYIKARSAFMYIVTRLISDVHFHITGPKLTFKFYNYRHCNTSMSPKTADYYPSGRVIASLLGNCKVLCYANMNVNLFRVSANQISVFSITQQSR